ncbi:midcut-by-XrtH protein [Parahaliea mediterranea]|uniref:Midcut-by-XrtH protein n=1 Tax=Parahaliea mediterranea TaxID=651086 RepID=A0A939DDP9_9GAMM|nr:midcut-by-XrtH protein [Parahaliea mediterranea]MBN7796343.1 midcut-by-XrtH protein [Parahaliea mediterranea]
MPVTKRISTALAALLAPAATLAQPSGTLSYGPATLAEAVPIPTMVLIPLGLALAAIGVRVVRRRDAQRALGVLLTLGGAATLLSAGMSVRDATALPPPPVELTDPAGGNIAVPTGAREYINRSGVALEILSVTTPASYCVSDSPAGECLAGLVLADSATCGTSFTCTPPVPAEAIGDAMSVDNGTSAQINVLGNDLGDAPLRVISFGDTVANADTHPADGATTGSFPAPGGGTLDVSVAATGTWTVLANGTTGTGAISAYYVLEAGNATTDSGQVDIRFGDSPLARDDTRSNLGAGNEYTTNVGVTLNVSAGSGLLNNDTLGSPATLLTAWGGGDASGSVDRPPGTARPLAGGMLTVNADGSFDLVNPILPGTYTFHYILDNGIGSSQASVEIEVN